MSLFLKIHDLCDVVSVLVQQTEQPTTYLLAGIPPIIRDSMSSMSAASTSRGSRRSITSKYNSQTFCLPCAKVVNEEWTQTALDLTVGLLGAPFNVALLKMYKVWYPSTASKYLHHLVYVVSVQASETKKRTRTGIYKWMTTEELIAAKSQGFLHSPEILTLVAMVKQATSREYCAQPDCFSANRDILMEILETQTLPNGQNTNPSHLELLRSAEMDRAEQIMIYRDYMLSCFPYLYMHPSMFAKNVGEIWPDWSYEDYLELFRAADVTNRGALSFSDYLIIFAICDINTPHIGRSAEMRCRYIFRFFDRKSNGTLALGEFRHLLQQIHKAKRLTLSQDGTSLEKELDLYTSTLGIDATHPISLNNFMLAAGDLRLRGTGSLLRFTKSLREYMFVRGIGGENSSLTISTMAPRHSINYSLRNLVSLDAGNKESKTFSLAMHIIKIGPFGQNFVVEPLANRTECVSPSSIFSLRSVNRKTSADVFNLRMPANEILCALRVFAAANEVSGKPAFAWGKADMSRLGTSLIALSTAVRSIMMSERRMLAIPAPVYVLGDLHGNFHDLLFFERTFWGLTPTLTPTNILFLGDYVDRGPCGVEVVAYLFSYKIMNPRKVFLLRGNHEIRDIQKSFTFFQECVTKFGEGIGGDLWTAVNNAFDAMPLAALIDGRVFCCHGGIPPPWVCNDMTLCERIPVPLPLPDQQSELAWNLMWNDPLRNNELNADDRKEMDARNGFLPNKRRSTGYVFSSDAFDAFLEQNHYTHMIRAHEHQATGAALQFDGRLLTVFSTSHYCNGTNDAGCILVEPSKIRVLRLSTRP